MSTPCAECGEPISPDAPTYAVSAELESNPAECAEYTFHASCWYKVSRNWDPSPD
jgi:hypothetical protein